MEGLRSGCSLARLFVPAGSRVYLLWQGLLCSNFMSMFTVLVKFGFRHNVSEPSMVPGLAALILLPYSTKTADQCLHAEVV